MRRLLVLLIFIPVLGACVTGALNLRQGIASFKTQDYRSAFIRLKPEAEKGQPDAQYAIGFMYYYGQGVVENREQAWYWINRAASLGQPNAIVAVQLLERGSLEKKRIFDNRTLQHFPVEKKMY